MMLKTAIVTRHNANPSGGEFFKGVFVWLSITSGSLFEVSDWRLRESGSPTDPGLFFFRENALEKELRI